MRIGTPRLPGLLLFLALAVACGNDESTDSMTPTQTTSLYHLDLDAFRKLARDTSCADVHNLLFLIDNRFVFWERDSKCADAAYARTLYDRKPDAVLCNLMDSIAGPQRICKGDPSWTGMFDVIIDHLDKSDLGLGSGHTVRRIEF